MLYHTCCLSFILCKSSSFILIAIQHSLKVPQLIFLLQVLLHYLHILFLMHQWENFRVYI